MNLMPQGYALYAAASLGEGIGEPCLCLVVGWVLSDGDNAAEPVLLEVGQTQMAYRVAPGAIAYIGHDLGQARAACGLSSSQRAERRWTAARYAKGATALCGLLNAHEPHLWQPDGHDHEIRCTGAATAA